MRPRSARREPRATIREGSRASPRAWPRRGSRPRHPSAVGSRGRRGWRLGASTRGWRCPRRSRGPPRGKPSRPTSLAAGVRAEWARRARQRRDTASGDRALDLCPVREGLRLTGHDCLDWWMLLRWTWDTDRYLRMEFSMKMYRVHIKGETNALWLCWRPSSQSHPRASLPSEEDDDARRRERRRGGVLRGEA